MSQLLLRRLIAVPSAKEQNQLDDPINKKAKPEIDECPPIHQTPVSGSGRKVGRQPKVDGIACDHGNQIFDPARTLRSHIVEGRSIENCIIPASSRSL
jgi:hypothetical protein